MRYDSKIGEILETISEEITHTESFKNTPIFYDFLEVDENNLPPQCIIYKPLDWRMDVSNCNYERQLDIVLLITSEERREGIVGQLFMFAEKMKEIIDDVSSTARIHMNFINGSPVHGFEYTRVSKDSYKEGKQLFTSMIVLSYSIKY